MPILAHKPNRIEDAVTAMSPTVYKFAHKFARNHKSNDFDDIVQLGFEGLIQAYNRYDGSKGCAFSSYAYQWIFAWINDDRRKTYKVYNNTGFKAVEDYDLGAYEMPLDEKLDNDKMVAKMDQTTRAIHAARLQGYTYRAIAEAMTSLGKPCTLHQIRRRHMAALEE